MLPWTPPSNLGGGGQQQQGQQQHGGQQQRPPLNAGSQGWGNPPQGQGQPQPQQQQQGQQQQGQMHILQPEGPPQPSPITLSSVLHYLQTEWRRYERERNEWEIERGEMRVSLCFLTLETVYGFACLRRTLYANLWHASLAWRSPGTLALHISS